MPCHQQESGGGKSGAAGLQWDVRQQEVVHAAGPKRAGENSKTVFSGRMPDVLPACFAWQE